MAIGRRTVLLGALSGAVGLTGLGRAARAFASEAQGLSLYHLHTAETLRIVYRERGELVGGALDEINYFLRDFRNDEMHSIDVALLDELCRLHDTFEGRGRFEVISGYRSPQTSLCATIRPASPRTASTSRAARSTCGSRARKRIACATRRSRCTRAVSATTPTRISCTSTRASFAPGSLSARSAPTVAATGSIR
jgi:uncharacterized protein YcbK (DUF882 family)